MGFQTANVQFQQAPGVAGDFATNNPFSSVPAPEAGYVAGSTGCNVGVFAWVDPADVTGRQVINSSATTLVPRGFVNRANNALITVYLADATMLIPTGNPVTLMAKGDFFFKVTVGAATIGQKAFAKLTDGTIQPGTAGASIPGYIETEFKITVGAAVGEFATMSN
jgi:hypothetical protein